LIVPVDTPESEVQLSKASKFEYPPVQGRSGDANVPPPPVELINWTNGINNMINGANNLVFAKEIV